MRPSATAAVERERNRGGGGVAVEVDGDDHLFARDAELVGRGVDDAAVGLMRHEPVDVGGGSRRRPRNSLDDVRHHADGVPEHLLAFHAQMADRLRRRRAAVDVELGAVAAVRARVSRRSRRRVARAVALTRLQHDRPGAVAEQHAGRAVLQSSRRENVSAPITSARLCEPETRTCPLSSPRTRSRSRPPADRRPTPWAIPSAA